MIEVPEITADELAGLLKGDRGVAIFDVREGWELALASLPQGAFEHLPLSTLLRHGRSALPATPPEAGTIVICHHGIRSAQVARWLMDLGWDGVSHLRGGLQAYAQQVDPGIGTY